MNLNRSGDFDDPLDDILSAPVAAPARPAMPEGVPETAGLHWEPCRKCSGTGSYRHFGTCFACKGKGGATFKATAPVRAANRARAHERAERKRADAWEAFVAENQGAAEWLERRAPTFDFAREMIEAVKKFGSLTAGQSAAVNKCMLRDAERDAERAKARETIAQAAPACSPEEIEKAFASALGKGLKAPRLRLAGYRFSPAKATGRNPGAIYVKAGDQYLGKIMGAKFLKSFECTEAQRDEIVRVASDPKNSAIEYGKRMGQCAVCARALTDPESVAAGIGPICAAGFGW